MLVLLIASIALAALGGILRARTPNMLVPLGRRVARKRDLASQAPLSQEQSAETRALGALHDGQRPITTVLALKRLARRAARTQKRCIPAKALLDLVTLRRTEHDDAVARAVGTEQKFSAVTLRVLWGLVLGGDVALVASALRAESDEVNPAESWFSAAAISIAVFSLGKIVGTGIKKDDGKDTRRAALLAAGGLAITAVSLSMMRAGMGLVAWVGLSLAPAAASAALEVLGPDPTQKAVARSKRRLDWSLRRLSQTLRRLSRAQQALGASIISLQSKLDRDLVLRAKMEAVPLGDASVKIDQLASAHIGKLFGPHEAVFNQALRILGVDPAERRPASETKTTHTADISIPVTDLRDSRPNQPISTNGHKPVDPAPAGSFS